jgi:hypothetical protein
VAQWQAVHEGRRETVSGGNRHPRRQVHLGHFLDAIRSVSDCWRASASSPSTAASATFRGSRTFTGCSLGEAIECVTFNPARCLALMIGREPSGRGRMRTWSFLIGAGMCSAHGSRERKCGRKNDSFVHGGKN